MTVALGYIISSGANVPAKNGWQVLTCEMTKHASGRAARTAVIGRLDGGMTASDWSAQGQATSSHSLRATCSFEQARPQQSSFVIPFAFQIPRERSFIFESWSPSQCINISCFQLICIEWFPSLDVLFIETQGQTAALAWFSTFLTRVVSFSRTRAQISFFPLCGSNLKMWLLCKRLNWQQRIKQKKNLLHFFKFNS